MDINHYQSMAKKTAIYPESNTGSKMALAYVALGLSEAGEVQGKVKKYIRGDFELTKDMRLAIIDELGDVFWYAVVLCEELGFDASLALERNLDKLASRQSRDVLKGDGDNR